MVYMCKALRKTPTASSEIFAGKLLYFFKIIIIIFFSTLLLIFFLSNFISRVNADI